MCSELFWANFSYSREIIDWTLIQNWNSWRFIGISLNFEIGIKKKFSCLIEFDYIFQEYLRAKYYYFIAKASKFLLKLSWVFTTWVGPKFLPYENIPDFCELKTLPMFYN